MAEVVELNVITRLDLPPDRLLEGAKGKLESVIIIGYTEDGEEYFASSKADGGTCLWLIERYKAALLAAVDEAYG